MAGNKTVETGASVRDFIDSVENEHKRRDSRELVTLMEAISGSRAAMWGSSMVGFGRYQYRYASGREGEFFLTGFSPRKTALTVYVMPGLERYADQLERLGPHKTGKSCLYLKSLDAVDREVLEEIITDSVEYMRKNHHCA
jgi:hypothetical protein